MPNFYSFAKGYPDVFWFEDIKFDKLGVSADFTLECLFDTFSTHERQTVHRIRRTANSGHKLYSDGAAPTTGFGIGTA